MFAASASVHGQCQYEVTLIHAPFCAGGWQPITSGEDISENGVVVGWYEQCQSTTRDEAFVWSEQGGFVTLPRPAGIISARALAISDNGSVIVGQMIKQSGSPEPRIVAFVYNNGQMVELPVLPGDHWGTPTEVTNDGLIVGYSQNVISGPTTAVRWVNQQIQAYPWIGDPDSSALATNNGDDVTGWIGDGLITTPLLQTLTDIVYLPIGPKAMRGFPRAINDNKNIVGNIGVPPGQPTPAYSTPVKWHDSSYTELPLLPECPETGLALDINAANVIVGNCNGTGSTGPTVWIDSVPFDLNLNVDDPSVVFLETVAKVTDDGRILAFTNVFINGVNGVVAAALTPKDSAPSDLNHDCITNVSDLFLLLSEWNISGSFADINNSGNVDVSDLFLLLAGWG